MSAWKSTTTHEIWVVWSLLYNTICYRNYHSSVSQHWTQRNIASPPAPPSVRFANIYFDIALLVFLRRHRNNAQYVLTFATRRPTAKALPRAHVLISSHPSNIVASKGSNPPPTPPPPPPPPTLKRNIPSAHNEDNGKTYLFISYSCCAPFRT